MDWITPVLISTTSSGIYASFAKISEFYFKPTNSVMHINIVTLIIILLYSFLIKKVKINLNEINIYVILTGVLFALNNFFLLQSLNANDNNGLVFSLVRSQFALTYILSIIFLKEKIQLKKIFYILIIISGCIILTIKPKKKKERFQNKENSNIKNIVTNNIWILYTALTIISFSFFDITSKLSLKTVNPDILPVYVMSIVVIVLLILNKLKGNTILLEKQEKITFNKFKIPVKEKNQKIFSIISIILAGIFFGLFYIFLNISISKSNNPTEPKAILTLGLIIVSLFTFIYIKNEKLYKNFIIGAITLLVGVFLLAFSK